MHHVWARAIDGRDLFVDLDDRRDIIARLSRVLPEGGARCFAWTLMSNHLHLVLKTGHQRLGTLIQRVFTGYAMRFNGRCGRQGHLFQGRFGSRPVRDEADLLAVIRYVLRNPIEAGMIRGVERLAGYPWGGLAALMSRRAAFDFESIADTLALFAPDPQTARSRLLAWLERPEPVAAPLAVRLEQAIRSVCAELAVPEAELREGRRTRAASRARALVCKRAIHELGLGVTEVARALGLSHAAVSQALRRGDASKNEKGTSPS